MYETSEHKISAPASIKLVKAVSFKMFSYMTILMFACSVGWTAHVEDDATVSVAKDNIKAHTGDDIELECFGSKTDFIYYIRNRVIWTFKSDAVSPVKLTDGFFPAIDKQREFKEGKYGLYYTPLSDSSGFLFRLSKNDVGPEDEGTYTCSLTGERGNIVSQTSVRVTVNK